MPYLLSIPHAETQPLPFSHLVGAVSNCAVSTHAPTGPRGNIELPNYFLKLHLTAPHLPILGILDSIGTDESPITSGVRAETRQVPTRRDARNGTG